MKRVLIFCLVLTTTGACKHERAQSPEGGAASLGEQPSVRSSKEGKAEINLVISENTKLMMSFHEGANVSGDLLASLEKAPKNKQKEIKDYPVVFSRLKMMEEKYRVGASGMKSHIEDIRLQESELEAGRSNADAIHAIIESKENFFREYRGALMNMQLELNRLQELIRAAGVELITIPHDSLPGKMPER